MRSHADAKQLSTRGIQALKDDRETPYRMGTGNGSCRSPYNLGMRRYAVPLLLFAAIGTVVVVYVRNQGAGPDGDREDERSAKSEKSESRTDPDGSKTLLTRGKRETPTSLRRHKWLSELERVLQRDDLSNAYFYRSKIAEDIDAIVEDETLLRNLMAAIRKYGVDSRDPAKRKLLLPLLRVIHTDEAMQLIEQEYYRALNEEERMFLVLAMADPGHSPQIASPWIVDVAINSDNAEYRQLALDAVSDLKSHFKITGDVARQIYESSTRPRQRERALQTVAWAAHESTDAREFIRKKLRNPREEEFGLLLMTIDAWGSYKDAEYLKALADQFPASAMELREHAKRIRRHRLTEEGKEPPPETPPGTPDE
jgi:hypothetical protein